MTLIFSAHESSFLATLLRWSSVSRDMTFSMYVANCWKRSINVGKCAASHSLSTLKIDAMRSTTIANASLDSHGGRTP